MPAMLDDPTAPAIYRVSGPEPFPLPFGPLPPEIQLRQVTLRDRVTIATLIPFSSPAQVPPKLAAYLCELLNREIEKGDTYPMVTPMPLSSFAPYWFSNFGAVMIMGEVQSVEEATMMENRGVDWARECLGSFYIKPNYPGRSSHVCNGGFLVTDAARNRGVGRLMGECYLEWAPKLGYSYSVFNLVYETNMASLRIWDALGFKRIGRVKGCGNLKSYPDQLIDAIIFGRELGGESDEFVTEERFDKIRWYLKTGSYPQSSDRAEKSRLRSAATHYRLIPNPNAKVDGEEDILMLKGKEVISDPHKQYEIARKMHASGHGGINKTTANIAEKYHWVRIKETVSVAIRNCTECKETTSKMSQPYMRESTSSRRTTRSRDDPPERVDGEDRFYRSVKPEPSPMITTGGYGASPTSPDEVLAMQGFLESNNNRSAALHAQQSPPPQQQSAAAPLSSSAAAATHQQQAPMANMQYHTTPDYADLPVDPRIMQSMQAWHASQAMDLDDAYGGAGGGGQHHQATGLGVDAGEADEVAARLREELEMQIRQEEEQSRVFG